MDDACIILWAKSTGDCAVFSFKAHSLRFSTRDLEYEIDGFCKSPNLLCGAIPFSELIDLKQVRAMNHHPRPLFHIQGRG